MANKKYFASLICRETDADPLFGHPRIELS